MKSIQLILAFIFCLSLGATAQNSIVGKWKITIPTKEGDLTEVVLNISDGGDYNIDFGMDGNNDIVGKYELKDDQITVWDVSGAMACPADQKGVYNFVVTDEKLTLMRISDDCTGRGGPEGKMAFTKL